MQYTITTICITGAGPDDATKVRHRGDEGVLATLVAETAVALSEFEAEHGEIFAVGDDGSVKRLSVAWAPWPWSESGQRIQVKEAGADTVE